METDPSKDTLSAFVDGALEPKEMERVARLLETRPELDAWVRRQERLRADLKISFSSIAQAAVPDRLIAAVHDTPVSWRWRLRQTLPSLTIHTLAPAGIALAAGLVLGLFLQPRGDLSVTGDRLLARGALANALDTQLASAGDTGAGPHIGISFRNRDGRDCRSFTDGDRAGLACHEGDRWAIAMLVHQPDATTGGAYRMAGSEMPAALRDTVTESIAGEPFNAAAEKAASENGWK